MVVGYLPKPGVVGRGQVGRVLDDQGPLGQRQPEAGKSSVPIN